MTTTWHAGWSADGALPDAAEASRLEPPDLDGSAIASVCGHDPRQMRDLRASLAVIARRTDDPTLRRLVVSVLRGQVSVRRVFEHPGFHRLTEASLDHLEQGLDRLDDEQREALLSQIGSDDLPTTPEDTELALMDGRPVPTREGEEQRRPG